MQQRFGKQHDARENYQVLVRNACPERYAVTQIEHGDAALELKLDRRPYQPVPIVGPRKCRGADRHEPHERNVPPREPRTSPKVLDDKEEPCRSDEGDSEVGEFCPQELFTQCGRGKLQGVSDLPYSGGESHQHEWPRAGRVQALQGDCREAQRDDA